MLKILFSTAFLLFTVFNVHAQKLQLPTKGNSVTYEGSVALNNTTPATTLCTKVKNWVIETTGSKNYNVSTEKSNDCFIEVEVSNILEPNGIFNDVEAYYTIYFTVNDGKVDYEVKNIYFKKAFAKYDVTNVYNAYLKDQPYVKEKNETKAAALKRHEYLMNLLNEHLKTLTSSFNNFMNAHANAVVNN